jgi:hypothetical protein
MKQLRLTGVMYPPPQQFDDVNKRSLVHQCEEFVSAELDMLISQLVGLPLLVEHCETELVGKVEVARKTAAGAVEIEAVISASCERGRNAIRDILAKELVGLSLSHEYCLSAPPGSSTAEAIKLDLVDGKAWRAISNTGGHEIRKKCREVSICAEPRRPDCKISATVCASALKQSQRGINAEHNELDTKVVGVFSCSAMESDPTTTQQPNAPVPEVVPEVAPEVVPEEVPDAVTEVVPETVAEVVPATVHTAATGETKEEIKNMQAVIKDAIDKVDRVESTNQSLRKQHGADIDKLTAQLAKQTDELLAYKQADAKQQERDLLQATQNRNKLFKELEHKLGQAGFAVDNHPAGKESAVAEAAIKHLVTASSAAIAMDNENNQLKRKQASLENFDYGTVNASRPKTSTSSYLAWRLENPRALKTEVDSKYREFARQTTGTVIVNASKWSQCEQVRPVPAAASMYSDHPEMAQAVAMQNTGRMISSQETVRMMKTSNVPSRR